MLDQTSREDEPSYYDEVEIEDFEFDDESKIYRYPCPCGDRFEISLQELESGEDIATCPSCSLIVRVIYDLEQFAKLETISLEPSPSDAGATPVVVA